MEIWQIALCGASLLAALIALVRLISLRASLRDIADELDSVLQTDTNAQLCVWSADPVVRRIAVRLNGQLRALRAERLRLQGGDTELKNAAANVSHDLRTPLTSICGYLDLLEQEPLPDNARRYLAVIRERTGAMRAMTDELLRYCVVASTADTLSPEPVSLNDVLEQSLAGAYGALAARGLTPQISMPERPVLRTLDKQALRRVFDNILTNAVRYAQDALCVTLTPDGTVCFSNHTDRLDAVQAGRLFDRFYTVCSARDGTGLGLSIAKLLTEKMGGHIAAAYENETLEITVCFDA